MLLCIVTDIVVFVFDDVMHLWKCLKLALVNWPTAIKFVARFFMIVCTNMSENLNINNHEVICTSSKLHTIYVVHLAVFFNLAILASIINYNVAMPTLLIITWIMKCHQAMYTQYHVCQAKMSGNVHYVPICQTYIYIVCQICQVYNNWMCV